MPLPAPAVLAPVVDTVTRPEPPVAEWMLTAPEDGEPSLPSPPAPRPVVLLAVMVIEEALLLEAWMPSPAPVDAAVPPAVITVAPTPVVLVTMPLTAPEAPPSAATVF